MTYHIPSLRPSAAAIAAVLVLSTAPAFAQSADVAPAAPVTLTPPAPTVAPAAPSISVASTPSVVPPIGAVSTPTIASPPLTLSVAPSAPQISAAQPSVTADPVAAPADMGTSDATAKPEPVRAKPMHRASAAATPKAETPKQIVADITPPTPSGKTALAEPVAPIAPAPVPPVVKAAPAAPATASTPAASDETLEIAGAAGAAILLLAGGAFALSRRRRDEEGDDMDDIGDDMGEIGIVEPVIAEPTVAREPVARPAPAFAVTEQSADLPAGFDLSRYGPHVQAAYRGPTADNPSLSLRTRLKRARFFDQRERAAAQASMAESTPPAWKSAAAATAPREWSFARQARPARTAMRPAYQG